MDLAEYLALPYRIAIFPELTSEGTVVFVARHPELEGCTSHGDTPEEALSNLREARELWLRMALEDGLTPPRPTVSQEAA